MNKSIIIKDNTMTGDELLNDAFNLSIPEEFLDYWYLKISDGLTTQQEIDSPALDEIGRLADILEMEFKND